ncbi:iron chaperone [Nocardia sp. NPDC058379]|uniref:iron chaperone n=1 Tax=unclassified Nocardia TaxID=2637762 RepID=UPI00365A1C04
MATSKSRSAAAFSAEERAAMKEHAQELKTAARRGKTSKADGEADLLAKVAEMPEPDRSIATRIHEIVMTEAPDLTPKTWYGQPAWAKDGKVVCFFQSAAKFKTRYATLGFSDTATIDDGTMWPTAFGLTALTPADEARIAELVRKAVH